MDHRIDLRRRFVIVALAGLTFTQCNGNGGDTEDASASGDGAPDRSTPVDAAGDAASDDADGSMACVGSDASVSDFVGYTRVATLDPCCRIDVPIALSSLPPFQWDACKTGRPSCQEFHVSWTNPDQPRLFAYGHAWGSVHGSSSLEVVIWRGTSDVEDILYDIGSGKPLKAWRTDRTNSDCLANLAANSDRVIPIAMTTSQPFRIGNEALDGGPAPSATFETLGPPTILATEAIQSYDLSDQVFAFAASPGGAIVRGPVGGPYVRSAGGGQLVRKPMVVGDLVLGLAEKGNAGYAQVDAIASDGGVAPFLFASATHVSGQASDGNDMFWIEASGGATAQDPPTKCEAWAAPVSSTPPTTQARRKLAVLSTCGTVTDTFAVAGYLAVRMSPTAIAVIRASDGMTREVASTPNRTFGGIANVTSTEIWVTEAGSKGDERYLSLVRLKYPAW